MNIVFDEIKKLLVPCIVQALITYALFALNGYSSLIIFATIIFATIYGLINFWMLGSAISVALSRSPQGAQVYMVSQYFIRYIITGMIIYYSIILPMINPLAVAIPMFFPKIALVLRSLSSKKRRER